jgi:hypothetical protein
MTAPKKIFAGIGIATMVGLIIYLVRHYNKYRMHEQVAEHGYETAHDRLFPKKQNWGNKNHYGPVLPS